jgi:hypothetical protein
VRRQLALEWKLRRVAKVCCGKQVPTEAHLASRAAVASTTTWSAGPTDATLRVDRHVAASGHLCVGSQPTDTTHELLRCLSTRLATPRLGVLSNRPPPLRAVAVLLVLLATVFLVTKLLLRAVTRALAVLLQGLTLLELGLHLFRRPAHCCAASLVLV